MWQDLYLSHTHTPRWVLSLSYPPRAHLSLLYLSSLLQLKLLQRVVPTECLHPWLPFTLYPTLHQKPAASLHWTCVQFNMEDLQWPLCWPIPLTVFTPHFPWHSEQYLSELATPSSLKYSLLGLWFSPSYCFSFSVQSPPLQKVYVLWCLGTNAGLSFLPTVSPRGVSSSVP